jgi:uncharacterized alpha-E superfamily protein
MLSRIAEATFWLARYLERADDIARYLGVHYHFLLESVGGPSTEGAWRSMLDLLGDTEDYAARGLPLEARPILEFLVLDDSNPSSIRSCVRAARENGRLIRDRISSEVWEELNTFHHWIEGAAAEAARMLDEPHAFLVEVGRAIQGLHGVAEATMFHDVGWQFLRAGTYLERAGLTARFLRARYPELVAAEAVVAGRMGPLGSHLGMAILKAASAYEAYRRVHHTRVEARRVAELLILSPLFPRSIRFCLAGLDYAVRAVRRTPAGTYRTEADRLAGRALGEIAYVGIDEVLAAPIEAFLDRIVQRCDEVGQAIAFVFFVHPPVKADEEPLALAVPR